MKGVDVFPAAEMVMPITQYKTSLAKDDVNTFQNVCTYFAILTGYLFMHGNVSSSTLVQLTTTFKVLSSLCPEAKLDCKTMATLVLAHTKLVNSNIPMINATQIISKLKDDVPFNTTLYKGFPNMI